MINVLYVDDEEALLDISKLYIERAGKFTVDTAPSAHIGLEKINRTPYDAIVSDYQMPDMDGIEFLKVTRQHYPVLPFIIFTGKGREEIAVQAFEAGADFYLQKGGEPKSQFAELAHKITIAVQHRLDQKALTDSEERYRSVVENAAEGIVVVQDGTVQYANRQALDMVQADFENILKKPFTDFIHPDDRALVFDRYQRRIRGEQVPQYYDFRIIGKTGKITTVQISAVQISWNGKPATLNFLIDITERKRVEKDLQRSHTRIQNAMDAGDIAWWEMDCLTGAVICHENKARMLGYPPAQFSHYTDFTNLLHPDDYERTMQAMRDHLARKLPRYDTEYRIKTASGEYLWFRDLGGISEYDESGKPKKVTGIVIDISERKKAEETLRQSEQRYRSLFSNMLDGFAYCKMLYENDQPKDFVYLEVNDAFGQLTGLQNVTGKKATEAIPGIREMNPELFDIYGRVALTSTPERFEVYVEPLKLWLAISVYSPEKGYFVAVFDNITERKQNEDALKFQNILLSTQSESSIDGILVIDDAGKIVSFNQRFVQIWEIPPEVIASRSDEHALKSVANKLVHPEEFLAQVKYLYAHKDEKSRDEIALLDGRTLDRYSTPMTGADGKYYGRIWYFRDITERKQNEEALRHANRQLNLLSSITRHDILNQLLALKGYIELSRESLFDKDKITEFLAKEEKAATTIEHQITFTKNYQELGVKEPAWQNVNASVHRATTTLPMRNVRVQTDRTDLEVYADPLFEKVFYNLIENALKYGGEQMTTIRVSSQKSDTGLTLVCEDDGVGITGEEKKHLFTRGFGKNTGLGLFLSREILSITDITITENGTPGKGARFEMSVPKGAYRFGDADKSNER